MGRLSPEVLFKIVSQKNNVYIYIYKHIYDTYVYHMMLAKMSNLMCLILSIAATLFNHPIIKVSTYHVGVYPNSRLRRFQKRHESRLAKLLHGSESGKTLLQLCFCREGIQMSYEECSWSTFLAAKNRELL